MKKKGKESKLNVALTSLLVVCVCLLSFSIGVIAGKGWSDREYQVRYIEKDNHVKAAKEDTEPLGDEMTQKEVELLTQRALEEAKAEQPEMKVEESQSTSALDKMESQVDGSESRQVASETKEEDKEENEPKGREASTAKDSSPQGERQVSSLMPKPSTPKPTAVDYTVQVAAYKTMDEAERHSQKLIDKGFPAFPVKAIIDGNMWYRVSIGSFKTKNQAMKYEKALKRQAVVKNTFVQKIQRLQK